MKRGSDMLHNRSAAPKRHVHHTHSLSGAHTHSASTHHAHSQHTPPPRAQLSNMHAPCPAAERGKTTTHHCVLDATKSERADAARAAHTRTHTHHATHAHSAHVPLHAGGHMHAPSAAHTHHPHGSHTADRLQVLEDVQEAPPRSQDSSSSGGGDLAGDLGLACSSPAPVPATAAVALFSPDISAKTASDLLIKLSEATQKTQMKPGTRVEAEPHGETLPAGQEEPGPALSPDGPGASPEPPTLTHTPEGDTTHILASELLRKLAERQDMTCQGVKVKEEEEPMEVAVNSDLVPGGSVAEAAALATLSASNRGLRRLQIEERSSNSGAGLEDALHPGREMEAQGLLSVDAGTRRCSLGETEGQFSNVKSTSAVPGINMADSRPPVRVKRENDSASGAKVECQGLSEANMEYHTLSGAKMEYQGLSGAKMDYQHLSFVSNNLQFRVKTEKNDCFPGLAKMEDLCLAGVKLEGQPFAGSELEDHLLSGAKLPDQCLRAVLWQDMSVNLASTLLHQLSEKVSKANNHLIDRTSPKTNSPLIKVTATPASENSLPDTARSPHVSLSDGQTTFSSNQTITSYFYRCHVCGFETEGRGLFLEHMTVHRQWELSSYSLHCCVCGLSTNQEPEMRAHVDTHSTGVGGAITAGEPGCPSPSVATVTTVPVTTTASSAPGASSSSSSNEHRCRICQRLFPGQQDLLAHFQGHRQGNQYRCDLCGHLTRTANKLVEHVRVHTGERPFTCDLCPYSAKRRDSLRLHCKVKHPAHVASAAAASGAAARDAVHTHRSYAHGDAQQQQQRRNGQLTHHRGAALGHAPSTATTATTPSFALALRPSLSERPGWRDLSPLLPITTLLSLKHPPVSPPPPPSSSGAPPPPPVSPPPPSSGSTTTVKHSFLAYLGLMGSS